MPAKLIKSVSVIGAMTLLSRITGLLRDVVFAHLLGDGKAADVFFVAFRIPNFFRRISGEGAFSAAFVPVFTDYRMHQSPQTTTRFLQLMLGRFGAVLLVASALGVLGAPALVAAIAPGFLRDAAQFQLAVDATRLTFPYLFFISLVAMAAAMLNTCERFAAPAATPILLNLCLIGAAIWLAPHFAAGDAPLALGIGVLVAGLAQLLFQLPFLRREKLTLRPRLRQVAGDKSAAAGVARVFRLTLPAVFGASAAQINVLVGTLLASLLATGSISWLYYSDRLMEFPVGVFGIALGTAILPKLSRQAAAPMAFSRTLDWAARWVVLICAPAAVGLIALRAPLIATIYYHGDFTANGVHQAAAALAAFAFGLGAIVLVKVLAPGFYARQDTRTPVRIAVIAIAVNIALSVLLARPFGHVGLALATSLAAYLNAALLAHRLIRLRILMPTRGWLKFLAQVCIAAACMAVLLDFGARGDWLLWSPWRRALHLAAWVIGGAAVYFAMLRLTGLRLASLWRAPAGSE